MCGGCCGKGSTLGNNRGRIGFRLCHVKGFHDEDLGGMAVCVGVIEI